MLLVKVTARSWALETLAHLHAGVPGRQAPLIAATGAGRTAFGQSLAHLLDLGLLERNPGHGHPLRPEFRLTAQGKEVARIAHDIVQLTSEKGATKLLRRQWTLPVLAVARHPQRFTQIKTGLVGISDRALSQTLVALEERTWLRREVDAMQRPVRPLYQAADTGLRISKAIDFAA